MRFKRLRREGNTLYFQDTPIIQLGIIPKVQYGIEYFSWKGLVIKNQFIASVGYVSDTKGNSFEMHKTNDGDYFFITTRAGEKPTRYVISEKDLY